MLSLVSQYELNSDRSTGASIRQLKCDVGLAAVVCSGDSEHEQHQPCFHDDYH